MIYFISDWHLNHNKAFVYESRGFYSIEEMNETLIARHNSVVKPHDVVYVLGDCCLGGGSKENLLDNQYLINQFNGELRIMCGNHDTLSRVEMYKQCENVVDIAVAKFLNYKHYHFYLSHFPSLCSNLDFDKPLKARTISLCGHSHTIDPFSDFDKGLIYHCEVDAHYGFPISIEQIIEEIKERC